MRNIFDDLFDSLTSSWTRGFKEKDGYTVMEAKDHNGFLIIFNTLGVSKDDIEVTTSDKSQTLTGYDPYVSSQNKTETTYIRVAGNTKIEEINDQLFSVNYELLFKHKNPVEKIQYAVRDGLTIVYVKTKQPESATQTAESIEDGGTFDW